jgi:hypothetical protein
MCTLVKGFTLLSLSLRNSLPNHYTQCKPKATPQQFCSSTSLAPTPTTTNSHGISPTIGVVGLSKMSQQYTGRGSNGQRIHTFAHGYFHFVGQCQDFFADAFVLGTNHDTPF